MKLGATATRTGFIPVQATALRQVVRSLGVTELHHGGCVGGDMEFHDMALAEGVEKIVVHPSDIVSTWPVDWTRAVGLENRIFVLPPKRPLTRNKDIIRVTDKTIAGPGQREMLWAGSGTWAAVRYAFNMGKLHVIIGPDGEEIRVSRTANGWETK